MKTKKGFTLIELIVVIAILGIIVLLALPKFFGYNEKAIDTSIKADLKVVQNAVDVKIVDNGGLSPYGIEIGDAKELDITTLQPEYIKSLNKKEGYEFWIDGWDNVYYNGINPPTNITYENGALSWDEVKNADKYNIYILSDKKEVSLLEMIGVQTVFADSVEMNTKKKLYKTTDKLSIELPEGTYLVSSMNKKEESVAVGENFKNEKIEEGNKIEEDNIVEEIPSPIEEEFDININNDVTVKEDGTFSFEAGTWTYIGDNPTFVTKDNEFHTGGRKSSGYYSYDLSPDWKTATFELTVKNLLNGAEMSSSMFVRTGDTGIGFYFFPDRVEIYDITLVGITHQAPIKIIYLDATQYHVYRIVKENKVATAYIDGKNVGVFNLRDGSGHNQNRFFFGDGTSKTADSSTYYKDIKIAPGKALHLE